MFRPRVIAFLRIYSILLSIGLLASFHAKVDASDWHQWRGPEQNGVSREKNLPDRFSPDPQAADSNLVWKQPFGGRSTPLVMNERVFIINRSGEGINEQERVMCFDAHSGKVLWEHKFNVFLTDIVSVRLGWTNLAGDPETGNIYAHGTQGLLFCFDGKSGKVLWEHSLTEEYGRISGYGGRVTSPTVDGDLVIIGMLNASWGDQARGGNRFVAFDKRTGKVVWWGNTGRQPRDTYYSCPVVAVINGERLLIVGGAAGDITAFHVRTGERVWNYEFCTGAVNCSPVVSGSLVYIGHGEENIGSNIQGGVFCFDASQVADGKPKLVWKIEGIKAKFASPVIDEGRLYIADDVAKLFCLDAATGKQLWRFTYGRNCKGSPVLADGKLYVAEVNAKFHILQPGSSNCKRIFQHFFRSPDGVSDVEINGSPAVANGRIYFSTSEEILCIGKKNPTEKADLPATVTAEPVADPSAKVAHIQVVPADVVLEPGESVDFIVRCFDANGRFLKTTHASYALAAAPPPPAPPSPGAQPAKPQAPVAAPPALKGTITAKGKLSVDQSLPGQFGLVVAKADGISGSARVRVVSPLPIKQDFSKIPDGRVPGGWVNCQGKFAVQPLKDGSKALKKTATNASPLVARAFAYLGKPTLQDYTIQADLMGTRVRNDMPDMGIVASRYTLQLSGNAQKLRLLSWDALPRVDKTIDWDWKPNAWYRMKLTVSASGDKSIIRGKVWPREQPEPERWTIEFEDPTPNRNGSPALYAYATGIQENAPGSEIYYQNVAITPNPK